MVRTDERPQNPSREGCERPEATGVRARFTDLLEPLFDVVRPVINAGFDGYNEKFGVAFGMSIGTDIDIGPVNRLDLIAEYYPVIDRDDAVHAAENSFAFGIKAAVFPLFFWLPASYHTPPAAVSAIFAGLLTKVGVYALIRVFTLIFTRGQEDYHLILIVAGLTMLTGVLGAVAQNDFRRLLSFHIVSQIGYMIMGLGLFTTLALAGSILHIVHNIFAKTNLFLVSGVVYRLRGTYDLPSLGGLYRVFPFLSILFLISAFSLAGMPPLSGFWSKLLLIKAGLESEAYGLVVVALIVSLFTLFSMTKIWNQVFWKKSPKAFVYHPISWSLFLLPLVILAVLIVSFVLAAEPYVILMTRAAHQLLNPAEYIHSVLGETP